MLTYTFEKNSGISLYEQLYRYIKSDILSGRLTEGEKLPSKRTLATHLEISVITVKNAYEQLAAEGYIYGVEKKGYYVSRVETPLQSGTAAPLPEAKKEPHYVLDLVTNSISAEYFPFTVWSKAMRQTILEQDKGLLQPMPYNGALVLRRAIADNLQQFRGMTVDPEQIIIGAGTEFLYYLLIQLLGRDRIYAVEDPGYSKIGRIYESNQVPLRRIGLDDAGLSAQELRKSGADVVHISPSHHYPTGIVMPIGRRQELLRWAGEQEGRYILEDDYDSEFRFVGKPIPALQSIDTQEKVIYINTFSKSFSSTIRISYMVLPEHLMEKYHKELSFYACTVSTFEQYTLASFIGEGHFEKHINRMRNFYRGQRDLLMDCIKKHPNYSQVQIAEENSGLHFLLHVQTTLTDEQLVKKAAENGIHISCLSQYYHDQPESTLPHVILINYSGLNSEKIPQAVEKLFDSLWE